MAGFGNLSQVSYQHFVYYEWIMSVAPEDVVISLHSLEEGSVIIQLVTNGLREVYQDFRIIDEPEELLRRRSGRRRNTGETNSPPHKVISPDSDNSGINENVVSRDNTLLRRVIFLYQVFNEKALRMGAQPRNGSSVAVFELRQVFKILKLNQVSSLERRESIYLKVNSLKVKVRRNKITIDFWHSARPRVIQRIQYFRRNEGSFIRHTRDLYPLDEKYQTLAAKDFDFLVRNPQTEWASWQFDIEPHDGHYPFSAFFGKIKNYFDKYFRESTPERGIRVVNLQMKIFENRRDPRTKNQGLIMKVLPFLDKNTLAGIQLNVLNGTPDVTLNSPALRNCVQWNSCPILDITDSKILINDFRQIAGIRSVRMVWRQNDYRDLFEKLSGNIFQGHEVTFTFPLIENREARNLNREAIEDEISQCIREGIFHRNEIKIVFETNGCMTMKYRKRGNR